MKSIKWGFAFVLFVILAGAAFLVSFADVLAAMCPLDGDVPEGTGFIRKLLVYDIGPVIAIITLPISIPRTYLIGYMESFFDVRLISDQSELHQISSYIVLFMGDLAVFFTYCLILCIPYLLTMIIFKLMLTTLQRFGGETWR